MKMAKDGEIGLKRAKRAKGEVIRQEKAMKVIRATRIEKGGN
ncbi:MAG: hypothetical protein ABIL20_08300 [candidate division WOR-3 bacterium]